MHVCTVPTYYLCVCAAKAFDASGVGGEESRRRRRKRRENVSKYSMRNALKEEEES